MHRYIFWTSTSILLFSLLGFLGEKYWVLDLFSHFRYHYLLISILLGVLLLIFKFKNIPLYLMCSITFLINAVVILPYYSHNSSRASTGRAAEYKIVSLNLNSGNVSKAKVIGYIKQSQADFVFLYEINNAWADELIELEPLYPFAKVILQESNFGVGILSKWSLRHIGTYRDPIFNTFSIEVKIEDLGGLSLYAAHPFPPLGFEGTRSRNNHLSDLSDKLAVNKSKKILCGDLNISSWSPVFHSFIDKSSLEKTTGFGVVSTWPSALGWFGIPIDHCLVSEGVEVLSYRKGRAVGSDHFPIEMEVRLVEPRGLSSEEEPI